MQVDFFDPAPPPRVRQDLNLVLLLACSSLILPVNPDAPPKPNVMWNTDRGFLQAAFGPTCDGEAHTCDPSSRFPLGVAGATQLSEARSVIVFAFAGSWPLNNTTKHHCYGASSPWIDRHGRGHDFDDRLKETASHAATWDGENPPQLQSGRYSEDGHDRLRFEALLQGRRSALLY